MKFLGNWLSVFFEYFIYIMVIVVTVLIMFGLTKIVFPNNQTDGKKIFGFSCYDGGRIILSSTGSSYDHSERSIIEDKSNLKLYLPSNCIVVEN